MSLRKEREHRRVLGTWRFRRLNARIRVEETYAIALFAKKGFLRFDPISGSPYGIRGSSLIDVSSECEIHYRL